MSERKERTRALFKKGQKCLIPSFVYDGEKGEDIIIFEPAQVRNGRSRVCVKNIKRLKMVSYPVAGYESGKEDFGLWGVEVLLSDTLCAEK